MLFLISACSQLPLQRGEYDDVYFTSNDRPQVPIIVTDPAQLENIEAENIITLEKSSEQQVAPELVNKYNNGGDEMPTYYRSSEEDAEANFFSGDFERDNQAFNNQGFSVQNANNVGRFNSGFNAGFNSGFGNTFGFMRPSFGFGLGFGNTFATGFHSSFMFTNGFYDPFNPFAMQSFMQFNTFGSFGFYDPFFMGNSYYNPWFRRNRFRNNFFAGPGSVVIINNGELNAGNNRNFERGGRLRSTSSVNSVRADAMAGTQTRASTAPSNMRGTMNGGRTNSTIASRSGNVRASRSSVDKALTRANRRVSTDRSGSAYRGSSSGIMSNGRSSRAFTPSNASTTRSLMSSRDAYRNSRGVSFERNASSQSSRAFQSTQSVRSLRSTPARQSVYNRGTSGSSRGTSINRSSSSSNVRSIGRSSSSSSRGGGSISRSSSSRSSGGGATRSSSGGGSSRGGRGGN